MARNSAENLAANRARFLNRFSTISAIGQTGNGGVDRQALSVADIGTHEEVINWFSNGNYTIRIDRAGNLYITRNGTSKTSSVLAIGSHLDSQPTGGRFDGALGVVAGAEVLSVFDDHQIETYHSIQLIIWMNEEGSRFPPATMGSSFATGTISELELMATTDSNGQSFQAALDEYTGKLGLSPQVVPPPNKYLELHIEQGPILEERGLAIGIVSGVQGLCQFELIVTGRTAHAGTTPRAYRNDAFLLARTLMVEIDNVFAKMDELFRFTIGSCTVKPGAPNTIPDYVRFTIDLRHPDQLTLEHAEASIRQIVANHGTSAIELRKLLSQKPVVFDETCRQALEAAAQLCGLPHMAMASGATHDAATIARRLPAGMIFVPSKDGVSHHPEEFTSDDEMIAGVDVLLNAALHLALSQE